LLLSELEQYSVTWHVHIFEPQDFSLGDIPRHHMPRRKIVADETRLLPLPLLPLKARLLHALRRQESRLQ
jgi:hypothetical protein